MIKKSLLACLALLSLQMFAAPEAVEALAQEMIEEGADVRAGSTQKLGVFIVARGEAPITSTRAVAREAARSQAMKNLASFLNVKVTAKDTASSTYSSNGETEAVSEFFESMTETSVDEMLKGVQQLRSYVDGDTQYVLVYSTMRGGSKVDEYKAAVDAMGDKGTVQSIGEASNRDAALQKALRGAVEQVLGTVVVNHTSVKNFDQVKSKIFSGADGLVEEYRITDEAKTDDGLVRITVLAKVSKENLMKSYSVYMKSLGDPAFFIECSSPDLTSHFNQFFVDLGIRLTENPNEATFIIRCHGEYRDVTHPANGRSGKQLSLRFRVHEINDKATVLLDMKNDPRKSACFVGKNPDRQSEICSEKAFKQMKKPLHENIQKMVAKMMERHTDQLMRDDE